jgi:hypothetical protein
MTVTTFVRHTCADYDAWRAVYDGLDDWQRRNGVIAKSVHRSPEDGNDVLVVHQFASLADVEAFMSNDELRANMEKAGVLGPPRIEIFEDA